MIRVRFAPSPTGYLHIGGLRTALYNYLYAKQNNGTFILRIEDTDRTRMVEGAIDNLILTLEWSGIEFDEGPHKDGNFGPYTQSERLHIYKEHVNRLIDNGNAYPCFYSKERLKSIKEKNIPSDIVAEYDRRYRDISISEMYERMNEENHVIRLMTPSNENVEIHDQIRGNINFDLNLIQDQIIIKSDGYPTYHLASVVDDHLMQISHVIRGEEWIPSLPKHYLLYKSFNWEQPEFIHLPLLLNKDKTKLSKRQGDVAVEDYIQNGYLQESLINFVALLGWHGSDDKEIYSLNELVKSFSIDRIRSSGAIFDIQKLQWFNQKYINSMDLNDLLVLVNRELSNKWDIKPSMLKLVRSSMLTLQDAHNLLEPFFVFNINSIINDSSLITDSGIAPLLQELKNEIKNISNFNDRGFKDTILSLNSIENKNIWKPLRYAITGLLQGSDLNQFVNILGPKELYNRLQLLESNNII